MPPFLTLSPQQAASTEDYGQDDPFFANPQTAFVFPQSTSPGRPKLRLEPTGADDPAHNRLTWLDIVETVDAVLHFALLWSDVGWVPTTTIDTKHYWDSHVNDKSTGRGTIGAM